MSWFFWSTCLRSACSLLVVTPPPPAKSARYRTYLLARVSLAIGWLTHSGERLTALKFRHSVSKARLDLKQIVARARVWS